MKNYIVTFTNDAIKYDMERQQEAIKQELNGDDNYFSKINEEITFEQIDREVESAIYHKYDNFICLAEDEDIDILQDGLNAEYGNQFNEILVIPEAFGRLKEADMTQSNSAQNNSQSSSLYNDVEKGLERTFIKSKNLFNCIEFSKALLSKYPQNENLVYFGLLASSINNAYRKKIVNFEIHMANNLNYRVNLRDPANKDIYNKLSNTNNLPSFFNANCQDKISVMKVNGNKLKVIVVSAKGEEKVSKASNIHVIVYNLNYPFLNLLVPGIQNISKLLSTYTNGNTDVLFMAVGAIPGKQFLHTANMLSIAEAVPYQGSNLKETLERVIPHEIIFQCGTPTPENFVSSIQFNLKAFAPNCRELSIHLPSTLQGLVSTQQTLSSIFSKVNIEIDPNLPVFDTEKNIETFKAIEDLIMNKENNYKKCKSTKSEQIFKDQEKTNQEIAKEIQGKDAKDIEKMAKEAAGNNSAIMQEIESGWPAFVKSLIEVTIQFKQNPTEANKEKTEFDREKSQFISKILEPFTKDLQSFAPALMATGFGVIAKTLFDAGKSLMKSKQKQDPKTQKMLEENKNLILTDAYATIKTNFGGVDTSDKIAKNVEDIQKSEVIENAIESRNTLESEGITKD